MSTTDLHVALCTDGVYPQAMGGMQRHSRLLAEHLARSGKVRLTVIHPHSTNIFDPALGIREVQVGPIDEKRIYLFELQRYSRRIAREMHSIGPDVILAQGFTIWKDAGALLARTIVHPHGLEMFQGLTRKDKLLGWPFRRAMRAVLRQSAHCISLGGGLTKILHEQVDGSNCQVHVMPNAVDLPPSPLAYPEGPSDNAPMRLLFVGRFAFNKGLDLIEAVAQELIAEGRAGQVHFDLAGDGPLLQGMMDRGVAANITLHGRVNDEGLERLYSNCHALILPTRFEGMPTVVLEAMARSRPIIVSNVGATAELVDMHNGYLLPSGDRSALHQAILNMLERDPKVWRKMGEESRQRVEERFTWPAVTRQFEALFEQVAAH